MKIEETKLVEKKNVQLKQKINELKLVEIQELTTDIGSIFLLKIGGENVRLYLSRDEADIVAEYMTKVVLMTIIEFLRGSSSIEIQQMMRKNDTNNCRQEIMKGARK